MINEVITALDLPNAYMIHKGHEVYCSGPMGHPVGILSTIDGSDFISVGNPYDEGMFTLDPAQEGYDPSQLYCKICNAKGVTL